MASTNLDLARAARESARTHPGGSTERIAHLVLAAALSESHTTTGARRILTSEAGRIPPHIHDRAQALLEELTETKGVTRSGPN
ncbi:hypothetical protein DFP74_5785 [Nocardiopsis sp. Huas11]|uniref:hypothetical protein n=1 Tax=Nocardiopsis sp. Huas11 TaxID=2183912 RepID=UPI000EB43858|nr:hypothetical protein [Nocardiopsis sp. Huas11]RKS10038.1 hypothetical protein DFP74_5785 [Nocardiopsis sp. Huas11]